MIRYNYRICSGYYQWKSFGYSLEEPDARPSTLESGQYRSQRHRPPSFFCELAHPPSQSELTSFPLWFTKEGIWSIPNKHGKAYFGHDNNDLVWMCNSFMISNESNKKFRPLKICCSLDIIVMMLKTAFLISSLPGFNQFFLPVDMGDFLQKAPSENQQNRMTTTSKIVLGSPS